MEAAELGTAEEFFDCNELHFLCGNANIKL